MGAPDRTALLEEARRFGIAAGVDDRPLAPGYDAAYQAWQRTCGLPAIASMHAWFAGWFDAKKRPSRHMEYARLQLTLGR